MIDLHKMACDGAERNLARDGFVAPLFFGQTEDGSVLATPMSGYDTRAEKEATFISRMLGLRGHGATKLTLVSDTFYSKKVKEDVDGEWIAPSQDPDSQEAIIVQTCSAEGNKIALLTYGREDTGDIRIDGWEIMPDAVEGWVIETMAKVLEADIPDDILAALISATGMEIFMAVGSGEEE